MTEMSSPRFAPIHQGPDCTSPTIKKCPNFLPLYEAVAQMTASMEWIKNSITTNTTKIDELADARSIDHEMMVKVNEKMKSLVGNGNSDLEPIIPEMQRKLKAIGEFLSDHKSNIEALDGERGIITQCQQLKENTGRLTFRVAFITGGVGTAIGVVGTALFAACWDFIKKKMGL